MPDEPTPNWQALLDTLDQAYEQLAALTGKLERVHAARGPCAARTAASAASMTSPSSRSRPRRPPDHADLLEHSQPHGPGAPQFLAEDGSCRIYAHRPYVCRTQGLPLRWIDEDPDGQVVEMHDICPLNEPGPAIETLPTEECWTLGPFEEFFETANRCRWRPGKTRSAAGPVRHADRHS